MKYIHPNHDHVYYVQEDMWGVTVKQLTRGEPIGSTTKLEMNKDQYANFKRMLVEGGWNEQSAKR
jgi:hypothetical protein